MDSDYKKIKEISMVSHKTTGDKSDYEDLLRISDHWFSYKRTRIADGKEVEHWSYKTHSDVLMGKFRDVCKSLYEEFSNPHKAYSGKSVFKFNIRVTSKDGSHEDISKNGSFSDNDMSPIALAFLRAIPEFESYPEVISLFKSKYLTRKILSSLDKNDISAFMYAEGGAMGSPGCMDLITRDFNRYYTDGIYGRVTDASQFDVTELLVGFEHIASYGRKSLEILKINDENWMYLNLGAGNHLLLRHDMYRMVGDMVLDTEHPRMYGKWRRLVDTCGDDNSCITIEVEGDALENECNVLCHQVNLDGIMGGGIALSIANKYPDVEKEYANYANKTLGEVCFAKTDKYVIANCFSQTKSYDTDYNSLRLCLDKVVAYMQDNHLYTVAIPYKYGCGIANGDWDTVRSIFEEKLKGYTLVIYKLKSATQEKESKKEPLNNDPVKMIYEAVSCLHRRGYEKVRIMSYYSPSGCYFRCVISVKDNFDKTGFVCMEDENYPIFRYSTGADFDFFKKGESYENKTVEEFADKLLEVYPGLAELGKGKDSKYLAWYDGVLNVVSEGKYPYAFEDYGYDIYAAKQIRLTNGDWIEYAPPGTYKRPE